MKLQKEKKERIIKFLEKFGKSSTSKIAYAIKSDINFCKRYLYQLKKEGKIKIEEETSRTYWTLINKKEVK